MSNIDTDSLASDLPRPTGYKILVAMQKAEETHGGVIVKAETTVMAEQTLSQIGLVLELGSEAYKDKARFPSGEPFCKPGDFVMMRSYTGTRFKIGKNEFRLINDDSVEAIVPNPKVISRVL